MKLKDAIRLVKKHAEGNVAMAADLFYDIGNIWGFTDELPPNLTKDIMTYKYIK